MGCVLPLVGGLLPMALYALVIAWLDRYEREPWLLIVGAFLWGLVPAAIAALVSQLILDVLIRSIIGEGLAAEWLQTGLVAPMTEEIAKGFAVFLVFLIFRREFDSVLDGIVYGSLVGFGFGAIENVLYLFGVYAEEGIVALIILFILRAVLFGLNHAFFTSLIGVGLAVLRLARSQAIKLVALPVGLMLGITAHSLHNTLVLLTAAEGGPGLAALGIALLADWMGVLGLLITIVLALRRERLWIAEYLREEVETGLLSRQHYEVACSAWRRMLAGWAALRRGDLRRYRRLGRLYHLCTRLAFKKYQRARLGETALHQAAIEQLRQEIAAIQMQEA
jgi:RsiW-degrading membrane proteinase PrsW (M82 family)